MCPKSPVLLFLPNQIQIRERCYLFGVHTSTGLLFSDRATRVAEQVATKGSSATRVASSDTGLRLLAAVKPSSSALILGRWWQVMFSVRYVQTVTLVCLLTGPGRCDDCLKWIYLILYLFRAVALHMCFTINYWQFIFTLLHVSADHFSYHQSMYIDICSVHRVAEW